MNLVTYLLSAFDKLFALFVLVKCSVNKHCWFSFLHLAKQELWHNVCISHV